MKGLPPQSVFFGVALLAALATAVGASLRAKLDAGTAFGVFSLAVVGVLVGARALWCVGSPEAGLSVVWERPELVWHPLRGGYASLGGWLGGGFAAGLAVHQWTWGRRWAYTDVWVPSGLVGMAVARLGCLANGCDFGVLAGWGIRYAPGTPAFRAHVDRGAIGPEAVQSLPTFPLPVVMAAAILTIAVVALATRRRWRSGRTAVGAATAYFAARFVLEFFRAPETVEVLVGPVNLNHLLAGMGLVATAIFWRRYGTGTISGAPKSG